MYHRDQGTEDEVQILANSYAYSINQANQGSKISRDIRGQGIRLRGSSLAYSNLFCRRSRLIHGKTQYLCDFEGNEQRTKCTRKHRSSNPSFWPEAVPSTWKVDASVLHERETLSCKGKRLQSEKRAKGSIAEIPFCIVNAPIRLPNLDAQCLISSGAFCL
jgi:hypothetical protein